MLDAKRHESEYDPEDEASERRIMHVAEKLYGLVQAEDDKKDKKFIKQLCVTRFYS